jgi:hypothetical protein
LKIQGKRNLRKLIEKHQSFIEIKNVNRPLLCINVTGNRFAGSYKNTFKNIDFEKEVSPDDIVLDDYIKDVEYFIELNEKTGIDFLYPVTPYPYIPWIEAIIGCPIFAGKDSFYAEPFIKNLDSFSYKFNILENKWLNKLIEMQTALVTYLNGKYPVASSTLMRGPTDMLSAALGQNLLPLLLYDSPDKIKELSNIFTGELIKIDQIINNIAEDCNFPGYTINTFGIWTKEICQYFQDDAVIFLSPKFYNDLILNNHIFIDNSFSSTFYHLHPESLYILDYLIKLPNLKIIEVNREPEAVGPKLEKILPALKKIQESGKAVILCFADPGFKPDIIKKEAKILRDSLSFNGLCLEVFASDTKDAKIKIESLEKVFKL